VRRIEVRCWVSKTGKRPVKEWIAALDDSAFLKVDKMIGLLRELGRSEALPHTRYLGDNIWELRDRSTGPGYRIYYTWEGNTLVILLAAGTKRSQERDIKIAKRRLIRGI